MIALRLVFAALVRRTIEIADDVTDLDTLPVTCEKDEWAPAPPEIRRRARDVRRQHTRHDERPVAVVAAHADRVAAQMIHDRLYVLLHRRKRRRGSVRSCGQHETAIAIACAVLDERAQM